jgi:hypothetical protein
MRILPEKQPSRNLKIAAPPACGCPGCTAHVTRLEELNRQLALEVDRLRQAAREGQVAA